MKRQKRPQEEQVLLPTFNKMHLEEAGIPTGLDSVLKSKGAASEGTHRTNQKFGIELPETVKRALEIDKETGTTFWRDAIQKEMKIVSVALNILDEGEDEPKSGRKFMACHLIFDEKTLSLLRKARFVGNGTIVNSSDASTYASLRSKWHSQRLDEEAN